jgi:uncharacterized membrane protein YhaH (DUF805 family)
MEGGFFSFTGRYGRSKFVWTWIAIVLGVSIGVVLVVAIIGSAIGASPRDISTPAWNQALSITRGVLIFALMICPVTKRLHDLERPGTHYWLMFIPIYNIYFFFVLLCRKGTEGPNRYGPDPLAQHTYTDIDTGTQGNVLFSADQDS